VTRAGRAAGIGLAAGLGLAAAGAGRAPADGVPEDARSRVLVLEDCSSPIGRRELTLFANGTIRVRQGPPGAERVALAELAPERTQAFVRRLEAIDFSEADVEEPAPDGPWVESCRLLLALPGAPERRLAYGRYSTHSPALRAALFVLRDLQARVGPAQGDGRGLPADYEPVAGDVLERTDGVVFEVVGFTSEGNGVELCGTQQPLTVYVARDELRLQFVALLRAGRRP
jgi:hypothetical protein